MPRIRSRHPPGQSKRIQMNTGRGGNRTSVDLKRLPEEIYRVLTVRLSRMAQKLGVPKDLCEDVAQETWLRALKQRKQFRGEHSLDELHSWLGAIAHNLAVDARRDLARHPIQSLDNSASEARDEKEATRSDAAEWSECLGVWLARLQQEEPENYWLVCEHYLEGRTIRELAAERGWTAHQVSCRIYRAKRKIRLWASGLYPGGEHES